MRISTSTIFETGGSRISDLQVQLNRTQQQIAAGRKILDPADDPIGSARALVITQSASVNDQYATNRKSATNALSIAETTLGSVTNVLHNIKTSIVNAGNGALNDQDRNSIANELQGNLEELFGYANATDGVETYLFSGFNSSTAPFQKTVGGATYNGDQGKRSLQVGASRQIAISDIGSAIFGDIRTSNAQFNILPNPSNTGKAVATASISNSANLTGNNYEVLFDNGGTNFTVQNKTTGVVSLPSPTAYVSGGTYTVDGIDIQLTDTPTGPGPNDKFTIQPGNQNIFETLTDLINALKTPASSPAAKLELNASLNQANNNLDKSLSNVLVSRANLGTSLKELDDLDSAGDSLGLLFKQELAALQDLDYAKAITELNQNQTILQAAQQSFIKTSSLSLFNYIN
jgi:flagellar hook-associated protein 3 FlgL